MCYTSLVFTMPKLISPCRCFVHSILSSQHGEDPTCMTLEYRVFILNHNIYVLLNRVCLSVLGISNRSLYSSSTIVVLSKYNVKQYFP